MIRNKFSIFKLVLLFCAFSCSLMSYAGPNPVNGIGISYDVYDFGTYTSKKPLAYLSYNDPGNNNWYVPAHNFKNPVYLYHLNPNLVQQQMLNMRASGVDVLVLHMTMSDLASCESNACYNPFLDGTWGYVTDVSQQALRPQQKQNLIDILNYAVQVGFRKVFLRFNGDASTRTAWDEVAYQKEWNFIVNTRNSATNVLKNTATRLMIDLGGEQMGLFCSEGPCPIVKKYVERLWSDYTYTFGTSDTVGFSPIACPHIVAEGIKWYGALKPNEYAFSNYGGCPNQADAGSALVASWKALGASEAAKPISIIETGFNLQANAQSWATALSANPGLRVADVISWLTIGATCTGCDGHFSDAAVAALATTNMASNYVTLANKAGVDNLKPAVLNIDGSNCTSTLAAQFSTCAKINVASAGANSLWQVWVVLNNQPRNLFSCGSAAAVLSAGWMAKTYYSYKFEYYKVSSCSATPPLGTAIASSYISFR